MNLLRTILIFCVLLVSFSSVYANTNTMPLLAVAESGNETFGSIATLTIELIPGKGRVFLETYPLSRIDTQVSTRLAKEIACQFLNVDCSKYDFIYTIRSGSGLIAGPSAGASLAAITIATLEKQKVKTDVAISGTINSGGLIGPVGGLKYKIAAAASEGITTVLIPAGERFYSENGTQDFISLANNTLDLIEYGANLGVTVVEVSNVYDIMPYVSGKTYDRQTANIEIPAFYSSVMSNLASELCARAREINSSLDITHSHNSNSSFTISQGKLEVTGLPFFANTSISVNATYSTAVQLLNSSVAALEAEQYYAAASYCYGSLLQFRYLEWSNKDVADIQTIVNQSLADVPDVSEYSTITDLQTSMLVIERVEEAKRLYARATEYFEKNQTYLAISAYSNAYERHNSAHAWSQFFLHEGKEFAFDAEVLSGSCQLRLEEAQQRKSYLELYFPAPQEGVDSITRANEYAQSGHFQLCLFEASKAKAIFDVLLSTAGVSEENLPAYIEQKEQAVRDVILTQTARGIFPIIGYSYLEYAQSLSEQDPSASLLYLQYALELSNLDAYFPQTRKSSFSLNFTNSDSLLFGIMLGMIASLALMLLAKRF